jgi:anti-anti-sigma factor
MFVAFGESMVMLYNDAYAPIMAGKHPAGLGGTITEVWAEVWDAIGPMVHGVLRRQSSYAEDFMVLMHRHGFPQECYFTFSFSPMPTEIPGLLCVVTETSSRVIGGRRLATLRALGGLSAVDLASEAEACRETARVLAENPGDLPFSMVYLLDRDDGEARLVASTGVREGSALAPVSRPADPGDAVWRALRSGSEGLWPGLGPQFDDGLDPLPGGPQAPADAAVVVPLSGGADRPIGVLVAGLSSNLPMDEDYRTFVTLVGGQLSGVLADLRAYDEERRRTEALTALDRAKTAFFSSISHEFRTPLTLMLGPIDDMRAATRADGPLDREHLRTELDLVRRNGLRLGKLVGMLLDFSRAQAGRMDARFEPLELAEVTREPAEAFRFAMERAGLAYTVDCPDLGEPVYVDRELWEKVVLNLLSNALKYTLTGSVTVRLRRMTDHAVLEVADTGVGVPRDELPRIFERFHRVEGTARARSAEGTGIGLALTKELLELHGGTVSADSVLGEGTTLTVHLPFGAAHLPADELRPAGPAPRPAQTEAFLTEAWGWLRDHPAPTGTDHYGGGAADGADTTAGTATIGSETAGSPSEPAGRVLVVEDNSDMRSYLGRLLSPEYRVRLTGDGETALALALADPPDLVLTDVMLPGMDGIALLGELRAAPRTASVAVVLLSARAGQEAAVSGLAAGADDYLVKPFAREELLARVRAHLDLARRRTGESRRMRHLADAVVEINSARDVREALELVTRHARRLLGAQQAMTSLVADQDWTRAVTSVSLSDEYAAWGGHEPPATAPGLVAPARTGVSVVRLSRAELETDPRWSTPAGRARAHPPVRGLLAAPLTGGSGASMGLVQVLDRVSGDFSSDDEAVLIQLAAVASGVLEKAQLLQQQTEVAVTLQRAILGPTVLPAPFAARYEPAVGRLEVGGDWYDLVELGDDRYGVVVGDVVGRGLAAAAAMGQLRSAARALLAEGRAPADVLTALDTFAALIPDARCCTVFCAVIDGRRAEVRYSSAGHPPAVLVEAGGRHVLLSAAQAVPLAAARDVHRPESGAALPPGATLLLYTDGLVERAGEPIVRGIARVVDAVREERALAPTELADRLAARLIGGTHDDDVAYLLYRQPGLAVVTATDDDRTGALRDRVLATGGGTPSEEAAPADPSAVPLPRTALRVTTTVHEGLVTVVAEGEIDLSTVEEFGRALAAAESERLVVDLAGVEYIGSPGINALFQYTDARTEVVVARGGMVEHAMALTNLDHCVTVRVL